MKVAIFSIHSFDRPFFEKIKTNSHELVYFKEQLSAETAHLAKDFDGIAIFTSDSANEEILNLLHLYGVKFIALRSVGYDHVDIDTATELKIKVANVPEYSPFAIAEHTVAMILALNRKLILADNRIKRHDFSLGGLTGFDLNGKTVGIIGTGKIGSVLAKILHGFGCKVIAYDKIEESSLKSKYALHYTNLDELCKQSDIISLNLPLNKDTKYLINEQQISIMKNGVMLINTARGGIVNT
jgi:D-lactate dehydrogenase